MHYLRFLAGLHERLAPETYLEIGLRNGASLALATCRAVGVDPAYSLTAQLDGDFAILRTTSDDFFAEDDPLRHTGGRPYDLTFIDGLHLFEYSLRDFIHAERHSRRGAAIVFDDVLPRSVDEAARERHTDFWTGDVFKMRAVLAEYRPDLVVITVDTIPTGLALVLGLDPDNTVLADHYDEILAEFRAADPQDVPASVLQRDGVLDPQGVLDAPIWPAVRAARDSGAGLDAELLAGVATGPAAASAVAASEAWAAGLTTRQFRTDRMQLTESVAGALLTVPLDDVPDHGVDCSLLLGELHVPARISGGALRAWVSGLPGDYPLAVRVGDARVDCGVTLHVGAAGQLTVVDTPPPAPAATAPAPAAVATDSALRATAKRVPGLRSAVRAYRRLR